MAVEIGTASGHLDLLTKLVAFLTTNSALVAAGQQWATNRDITPAFDNLDGLSGQREVVLRAPGLAGTDEFYSGIVAFQNTLNDYYNWSMRGQVGYLGSVNHQSQPGRSEAQYLHLTNGTIPYWFIASGRRCIIVAKISTSYQIAYLGAYLPYATPTQVPYPMMVGGSSNVPSFRWSNNSTQHKSFFDPAQYSSSVYHVDGTWIRPYNTNNAEGSGVVDGDPRTVWNMGPYYGARNAELAWKRMRDNVDGTVSLFPIHITMDTPNVLGELDGMYAMSGYNNAGENLIQVGGVDHLVVGNIFRTNRWNYAAIRLA